MTKLYNGFLPFLIIFAIALTSFAAFFPIGPRLMQYSTIQPRVCFSDDDFERGYCYGYMRAILDHYLDREATASPLDCELDDFGQGECRGYSEAVASFGVNGFPQADAACFLGEILALRNVALHGWSTAIDILTWSETEEGQARIQAQGGQRSLEIHKEFLGRALQGLETVSARQSGDRLPAMCAISFRVQILWQ